MKTKEFGETEVVFEKYENGRLAIILTSPQRRIAILTVNLPGEPLEQGEFFVKTWSENQLIINDCRASGLFVDTGRRVKSGYVEAEVWRLA